MSDRSEIREEIHQLIKKIESSESNCKSTQQAMITAKIQAKDMAFVAKLERMIFEENKHLDEFMEDTFGSPNDVGGYRIFRNHLSKWYVETAKLVNAIIRYGNSTGKTYLINEQRANALVEYIDNVIKEYEEGKVSDTHIILDKLRIKASNLREAGYGSKELQLLNRIDALITKIDNELETGPRYTGDKTPDEEGTVTESAPASLFDQIVSYLGQLVLQYPEDEQEEELGQEPEKTILVRR